MRFVWLLLVNIYYFLTDEDLRYLAKHLARSFPPQGENMKPCYYGNPDILWMWSPVLITLGIIMAWALAGKLKEEWAEWRQIEPNT